jgi:hypothetical protein
MTELEDIDNQIKILQMKKKILIDAKEAEINKPYLDRLGKEVFEFLNSYKGFGPMKMKLLCSMKNITAADLVQAFPLLTRLNKHDTGIIVAAVNRGT